MSTCGSCGAEVIWARTTSGRRMPVDAEPRPDGNVVLHAAVSPGQAPTVTVLSKGDYVQPEDPRHTSHFATCLNADSHRRSRP